MTIVSVLYPQTATSRFDYGYYLRTHIPLVTERWSPLGLEKVEMVRGTASMDGGAPAFAMMATLYFTSDDHLQQALTTHGSEVLGDIPNFTDAEPMMQMGESVS
ncbi:MAG: EthD family reductase [Janthinobacterium lividum]